MKKLFPYSIKMMFVVILIISINSVVFAGSGRRMGTSGAQELTIPVGSVGTALGGSFTATISGVDAAYWNPAGIANLATNGEVMVSQMNWLADINVNYVAVINKVGRLGVLGATMTSLDFGDIAVTTTEMPDGTGEYYSPRYFVLGGLYSRKMTDRILFGAKMNLISEQVMNTSASGVAFDAGVQYSSKASGLKIGAVLKNLGPNMIFNGSDLEHDVTPDETEPGTSEEPLRIYLSDFELPTQMELGIAYPAIYTDQLKVTVGASFLNDNFYYDQYRIGAEVEFMDMAFVRGSYAIAEDPESNKFVSSSDDFLWGPGFGGGLKLSFGETKIMLDYAYRMTEYFNDNQTFSIRIGF